MTTDAARPGTDQGINLTEQRLTAEDRAALYPDLLCPVPTPEDRMRDASEQLGWTPGAATVNQPARTFAAYLDATERDQLDARAATAEQERDEALDDRDAYKEARDVLRVEINRVEQTRQEQVQALNAKLQDALWTAGQHATTAASLRQQRDRILADLTDAGNEVDQLTVDNARLRSELGAAQELIAVLDDVTEQLDRARAAYATRPSEEPEQQDAGQPEDLRSPLAAERDKLVETIGRLVSLPPEQIAQMHKVGYSGTTPALGSLPPRAQDEPARSETDVPDWVLMLVRGLAKYDREHPRLYRYISSGDYRQTECPCPLLEGVPAAVRAQAEREG